MSFKQVKVNSALVSQIQSYYDDMHTVNEVSVKFNIHKHIILRLGSKGLISLKGNSESIRDRGTRSGCFKWTKQQRRQQALKQGLGGYQPNAGHSKKFYVKDTAGRIVCLQSSYEKAFADILDSMDVEWVRPTYITYYSVGGKVARYWPDFFLPKYNLYIDTKNDFLIKKDATKIATVIEQNNLNLRVLAKAEINSEFINGLLTHSAECSLDKGGVVGAKPTQATNLPDVGASPT